LYREGRRRRYEQRLGDIERRSIIIDLKTSACELSA